MHSVSKQIVTVGEHAVIFLTALHITFRRQIPQPQRYLVSYYKL